MLIQVGYPCKWVNDSQHLILEYFDPICDSPSHVYHSALPFCPASSWLWEYYDAELSKEVKVVNGIPVKWGTCFRTISPNSDPWALTSWKHLIAVGSVSGDINILNAITGISTSILSGHTEDVGSLTFSSDGTLLVSGSHDNTVKLWDIQTGGVIRTFYGHTNSVLSVSISLDHTMIASGSLDTTIHLWDAQTGECSHIISGQMGGAIYSISFSPTNPQLLISGSRDNTIRWWDVGGHQVGPAYEGCNATFSSDGVCTISWGGSVATIRNSDSGVVVAKLHTSSNEIYCCCFSPDNKFVAASAGNNIYIWDITKSDPCLVETFVGHIDHIKFLTFTSSLISLSNDGLIKFWQIGTSPIDTIETNPESLPLASAPVVSITLQANDGIAISSHSNGVLRTWDILTGHCRASYNAPVTVDDVWLIDGRWILVWRTAKKVHILDTKQGEPLRTVDAPLNRLRLRISGDGSKVFLRSWKSIQAWSIQTGEVVGEVECPDRPCYNSLIVDGSRVGVLFGDSQTQ